MNSALGLAFLLEIVAFINFADLSRLITTNQIVHAVLFVILLIVLIAFWSVYMAPKAANKLSTTPYYLSKFVIYSLSAFAIFRYQTTILGVLFIVAAFIDEAVLYRHNLS